MYKIRSNRHKSRRLLFSIAAGLMLLAGVLLGKNYLPFGSDAFLNTQAAALQPAFGSELRALEDAPRYTIVAQADPFSGTVGGVLSVWYANRSQDDLTEIVFRLYPNAGSIYGGGSLTVQDATVDGQMVEPILSEDLTRLSVPLDQPLQQGQSITLEMRFLTEVPEVNEQGYGILSQANGVLFLAGWYPVLSVYSEGWQISEVPTVGDALLAETSLYEVWLSAPTGYSIISTGSVIDTQDDGEQATWHVASGPARDFAVVLSNQCEVQERRVGGLTLRSYTLPAQSPAHSPDVALSLLAEAFEAYQGLYGPYPYREFEMVESIITIGGYEFSGLVTVDEALRREGKLGDYRYLVAHEAAHQWWYGLVGTHTIQEPWLDEAHATYSAALYLERVAGAEEAEALIRYWQNKYAEAGMNEAPLNSSALDFSDWPNYEHSIYVQGALFLHELRQEMGDEAFFALEQQYQNAYRYKFGSTDSFLQLAVEVAGRELDPLYASKFDLPFEAGLDPSGETQ